MTIQDEIIKLDRQLSALRAQQSRCQHEWSDAKYNPYTGKEDRVLHGQRETQGVHSYQRVTSVDVEKPRWTRACKVCGIEQHTEKQSNVIMPKRQCPDFWV